MSQGQDLYIWKAKYTKAHFCLKSRGLSRILQSCSFSNNGSGGCLRLDWQGCSAASLMPAHAILGTAEQGWMNRVEAASQGLAGTAASGHPALNLGLSHQTWGIQNHQDLQTFCIGSPRTLRGCCSEHGICTPTYPLHEVAEGRRVCEDISLAGVQIPSWVFSCVPGTVGAPTKAYTFINYRLPRPPRWMLYFSVSDVTSKPRSWFAGRARKLSQAPHHPVTLGAGQAGKGPGEHYYI